MFIILTCLNNFLRKFQFVQSASRIWVQVKRWRGQVAGMLFIRCTFDVALNMHHWHVVYLISGHLGATCPESKLLRVQCATSGGARTSMLRTQSSDFLLTLSAWACRCLREGRPCGACRAANVGPDETPGPYSVGPVQGEPRPHATMY